jgi:hypothetical protein
MRLLLIFPDSVPVLDINLYFIHLILAIEMYRNARSSLYLCLTKKLPIQVPLSTESRYCLVLFPEIETKQGK